MLFRSNRRKVLRKYQIDYRMIPEPEPIEKNSFAENLSEISVHALKQLELAKKDLQAKDDQMKEMNRIANERVSEMSRINAQLQDHITLVENMTKSAQEKNFRLEKDIEKIENDRSTYRQLNDKLKEDLTQLKHKEKELTFRQTFLESQIEEKTKAVIQNEKMAIIGQITSRLAHDIRNPLNHMKICHDLLTKNPRMPSSDRIRNFSNINKGIMKISHVIEDVLDFVKLSELRLQVHPLNDVLESAMGSMRIPSSVVFKKVGTEIDIMCDFRKMSSIFSNIIQNALDSIDGSGQIIVNVIEQDDSIEIRITDSGPGVPEEQYSQIFEPMFTTKIHGSGLGLAICKMLVEQHGGTLNVMNSPSTFVIALPRV